MIQNVLKILFPSLLSFLFGILLTPRLTKLMYQHRLWKRVARNDSTTNSTTETFQKITNSKSEQSTPRVGGVIIWGTVIITALTVWLLQYFLNTEVTNKLDFISRNQTWLPLSALLLGGLVGFYEDMMEVFPGGGDHHNPWLHGLPRWLIVTVVSMLAIGYGLWFYFRLEMTSINIPFVGLVDFGWLFVPFFILVTLGTFSSRVIDGIDGLAGGVLAPVFAAYAVIAYAQNQIDLAAFCAVVFGGLLIFLWFNIPPARFYMGETGMLALTLTLVVVAFLTNAVMYLPIIALPLMVTSLSSAIQLGSKALRKGKRVFLIAPLHNLLLAKGWSRPKVAMRYWIISVMCAVAGVVLSLVS